MVLWMIYHFKEVYLRERLFQRKRLIENEEEEKRSFLKYVFRLNHISHLKLMCMLSGMYNNSDLFLQQFNNSECCYRKNHFYIPKQNQKKFFFSVNLKFLS